MTSAGPVNLLYFKRLEPTSFKIFFFGQELCGLDDGSRLDLFPTHNCVENSYHMPSKKSCTLDYVMQRSNKEGTTCEITRVWKPLGDRIAGKQFR